MGDTSASDPLYHESYSSTSSRLYKSPHSVNIDLRSSSQTAEPCKNVVLATLESGELPVETRSEFLKISSKENVFTFFAFVLLGAAAMAFWNTLIGCLYSVQTYIYPGHKDISDTITAVYTTMSLVITATLIKFQILNTNVLIIGAVGFIISALGMAIICQLATKGTGLILIHVVSALGGCCTALFESSMFGFASILPHNYVGAACLGLGVSGLLSFGGWILFSKVIFSMSKEGVQWAVLFYLSCTAAINGLAILFFLIICRRPWAVRSIRIAEAQHQEKKVAKAQRAGEPLALESRLADKLQDRQRTKFNIFMDASEQILNVSVTLWLTLMMFPNIAPFAWGRNVVETDMLMGIWQCGDFIGRYLPNLRRWIPFAAVKPKSVKYFTAARLLFVPVFMIIYRVSEERLGVLNTFWFQALAMFFFVATSGWICSLSSMYVPDCVEDADEKAQAATMYLLCLLLGLTIGVWMSKLWKL